MSDEKKDLDERFKKAFPYGICEVRPNGRQDVSGRVHEFFAWELSAAEKRGEERGRAEEAAKYKPLVALASRVPDPCKGRTCKCESNCRWKKEWLAMRDIIAALKALEGK